MIPAAVRAIVIRDGQIMVIKRTKPQLGAKYMVTPGGRIEPGEDQETALFRELAEETTVIVKNPRLVYIEEPNDGRWGTQYIYLCEYVSGEPQLHPASEELVIMEQGGGTYEPMWYPVDQLPDPDYPFRSTRLGDEIVDATQNGFPDESKRWTLDPPVVK